MPLDPTISLSVGNNVPSLDLAGSFKKGLDLRTAAMQPAVLQQQINASKAAQAQTEAGTPGVQAESDLKVKDAEYARFKAENAKNYMQADPNNPKAPPVFNQAAFNSDAIKNGFWTQALNDNAKSLANQSVQVKNATDAAAYVQNARANAATFLQAAQDKGVPVQKQMELLHGFAQFTDKNLPGTGEQLATGFLDQNGNFSPALVKTQAQSTMTPQQQEDLKLRQRQTTVSEKSQALAENIASPEHVRQVGEAQQSVVPATTRIESAQSAAANDLWVGKLNQGLAAIDNPELTEFVTKPGNLVKQVWGKYVETNASARALQDTLDAYNERNKTNLAISDGLASVRKILANEASAAANKSNVDKNIAANPTVRGAVGSQQPSQAGRPPTVVPKSSPGNSAATKTITIAQVDAYAKATGKSASVITRELADRGITVK